MRFDLRMATVLAAATGLGLFTAGCGSQASSGATTGSAAPLVASPVPTPAATPSDSPAPASAAAVTGPHRCHTGDVAVQFLPAQGATGHSFRSVALHNRAGGTCTVYGYVGMLLLDAAGRPLATVVQRGGGMLGTPAPRLVTLPPMAIAYFELEYSDIQSGPSPCPTSAQVEVTPPDETAHLVVSAALGPCQDGRMVITALHSGPPRA